MFNSFALNVVISLVFIYLLYSLLATIIQEILSSYLGLRARVLKKGIRRMLDDGTGYEALSRSFYEHPLIKYLGENKVHSKPSYLSAQNFSKVIVDLLRGKNVQPGEGIAPLIQTAFDSGKMQWDDTLINKDTLNYLKSLWVDSQGDIEKFKLKLEQWFDDTMERASGWFKKKVQFILFIIGFFLAISFNIDTIDIAKKLSNNPALAKQLADNAAAYLENHKSLAANTGTFNKLDSNNIEQSKKLLDSATALLQTDIKESNQLLGLGWKCNCVDSDKDTFCITENLHSWCIIGWLLTALAISLGAPFWFDLLNKLMKLRSSIPNSSDPQNRVDQKNAKNSSINPKG